MNTSCDSSVQYIGVDVKATWVDASSYCKRLHGSTLGTIMDACGNTAALDSLGDKQKSGIWIGLTDQDDYSDEGTFVWVDGTEFNYDNWHEGEPNNSHQDGEDCAFMYGREHVDQHDPDATYPYAGKWNDDSCFDPCDTEYFVCNYHGFITVNKTENWYNAQTYCQNTYGTSLANLEDISSINGRIIAKNTARYIAIEENIDENEDLWINKFSNNDTCKVMPGAGDQDDDDDEFLERDCNETHYFVCNFGIEKEFECLNDAPFEAHHMKLMAETVGIGVVIIFCIALLGYLHKKGEIFQEKRCFCNRTDDFKTMSLIKYAFHMWDFFSDILLCTDIFMVRVSVFKVQASVHFRFFV